VVFRGPKKNRFCLLILPLCFVFDFCFLVPWLPWPMGAVHTKGGVTIQPRRLRGVFVVVDLTELVVTPGARF
jgi:hypothetical protein